MIARSSFLLVCLAWIPLGAAVDFNRDVRPILAGKCYACHGPDEESRKGKLRLDVRESALKKEAIVPGDTEASELVYRIFTDDEDEVMPPPDIHSALTSEEKRILREWIAEGAEYSQHWGFVPPRRSEVPKVKDARWPRNDIDRFILADLEAAGRKPSAEANKSALVRRVYLDLVGLPPTIEQADAFLNDKGPRAYENLVDRLLESPQYGERWARAWLDLARYADTNGYEKDRPRSIWPYRDWVIRALNADMPYDQFSIEQLAGDMLPEATPSQLVATGFHRNTMLNEEGGIDPLEFRFHAMVDRVATTGIVWMGLTTGCAQCHTHKYDPITHTDYYSLMALLNNADEPDFNVPSPQVLARRKDTEAKIADAERKLQEEIPDFEKKLAAWTAEQRKSALDWEVLRPIQMKTNLPQLEVLEDGSIFSTGDITKRDHFTLRFKPDNAVVALRLEVLPDNRLPAGGPGRSYYEGRKGDFFLSDLIATTQVGEVIKFRDPSHDYGKISVGNGKAHAANVLDADGSTGWSTSGREGKASQLVLPLAKPLKAGTEFTFEMIFERHFAASLGRFRISAVSTQGDIRAKKLPAQVERLLVHDPSSGSVRLHFLRTAPSLAKSRKSLDTLRKQLPKLPVTLVMRERPASNPRPTHRHHRGEYLSPKEAVDPGVPAIFPQLPEGGPANRLTFARWLVSENNPLVDRVAVNRAWRAFFGRGLLLTSGDYGTQAPAPEHPELLDWLAVEFRARGHSIKQLHRLLVTSATYRQAAAPSSVAYAGFHRRRLEAEAIRDLLLKASGRLSEKMHGPSVFPPQPATVTSIAWGATRWNVSKGEDRYRRSLYTHTKRTAPFAAFTTFDASSGEGCVARRNRSNTPLQALTLLNDAMFLDYARAAGKLALAQSAEEQVQFLFRRYLTRSPSDPELRRIRQFLMAQQKRVEAGELEAHAITGESHATARQAALTLLARALQNLDETISQN